MKTNELQSIAAQEYHKAEGVSASMLDQIRKSPAHLRCYMDGELREESDALSKGTLIHRAIFEPDSLTTDSVCFIPETLWIERDRLSKLSSAVPVLSKAGSPITDGTTVQIQWNGQIAEAKNWIKENADRPQVLAKDWKVAQRIRDNAHRDGTVRALLSGGHAEQSLFVEDEHGTLRKSRFDYIATSGNMIPDLKTTRCASIDEFERSIERYAYFQRAAFYIDNANLAGLSKDTFVFICVETAPPYLVAVYQLDDLVLEAGRTLYKRDLQLYRNCVESGRWPGYGEGIRQIGLPSFAMRKLEEIL